VTHFGDTGSGEQADHGEAEAMSEYYLADQQAEERVRQREFEKKKDRAPAKSQDVKITLLGDFLFPSSESQGFDPYNSHHGKTPIEAWLHKRGRG
jgi:hypothetical protein